MKFCLNVNEDLQIGLKRIAELLEIELGSGITVNAVRGDRIGASLKDGVGTIYYRERCHFFRELGVFAENAKKNDSFDISEDGFFKTVGTMLDLSRGAALKIEALKKLIDYIAVMGYNMVWLYTEDLIELSGREYFGYMRGRYTAEELKEIDDYACEYGIEMVPCLECYGHMGKYLVWPEAAPIKDTAEVLLAREEKTFEFLDELIGTAASIFRSRRIHIGMDEAFDMGRGVFLNKEGYVPPAEIFGEYMQRLMAITDKYGLKPMMWSDMYMRHASRTGWPYDKEIVITDELRASVPEGVDLVFWHYGEEPECDEYMLEKHKALKRNVIFAGSAWSCSGHFPEHEYSLESESFSIKACRKTGVAEAVLTVWLDDNAECDFFAILPEFSMHAELCYNENVDRKMLADRFETVSGGSYEGFMTMGLYHNYFDNAEEFSGGYNFNKRFFGKHLFWQDIMEGLFDTQLYKRKMSSHYYGAAEKMKNYKGKWDCLYDFAEKVFSYLGTKTEIAEALAPAYKRGDKKELSRISELLLPRLKQETEALRLAHRKNRLSSCKSFGWAGLDLRYGGVIARCDSAKYLLDAYLCGELDRIDSLEEKRLDKELSAYTSYIQTMINNSKI